jgi:ParB-like chromosome segregation protein Spo0J
VIAGHGRLLAARRLGWGEAPTIRLDHLSEAQKRAFMIADNRLAEVAIWNDRLLAERRCHTNFGSARRGVWKAR